MANHRGRIILRCLFFTGVVMACNCFLHSYQGRKTGLGVVEGSGDVGHVRFPGSVSYDSAEQQYRITGSGANMWEGTDAFYFAWRRSSGDLVMTAKVDWSGTSGNPHRKAGWMVRESLAPDSPYADAVVHGDGLISLQYRLTKGGPTREIASPVRAPATLRFERRGDVFSLDLAKDGTSFQPVGSLTVPLPGSVYAGLAVCSHDDNLSATAVLTGVEFETRNLPPKVKRAVESTLETLSIESGERKIVRRARQHFEAPNWSPDGSYFVYNSGGRLYRLPVEGGEPQVIDTGSAIDCNNDHGFSPDGKQMALSHDVNDRSIISVVPAAGGTARKVTERGPSYWHGWSPDGKTLVYCAERKGEFDVYSIPVEGGEEQRLTTARGLDDGPEYSPDGKFIYFNSERTGLMKIWRMQPDGSGQTQVTTDADFADWFAHPSPDGKWLIFLSYEKDVKGHPPNKDVVLRLMPAEGGSPRIVAKFFGGQGTINVPSWSPDSRRVAFVSYRPVAPE